MRLGDRWWLWMQEHPWAPWVGVVAVIAAAIAVIIAGDYFLRWTCARGPHFGC